MWFVGGNINFLLPGHSLRTLDHLKLIGSTQMLAKSYEWFPHNQDKNVMAENSVMEKKYFVPIIV